MAPAGVYGSRGGPVNSFFSSTSHRPRSAVRTQARTHTRTGSQSGPLTPIQLARTPGAKCRRSPSASAPSFPFSSQALLPLFPHHDDGSGRPDSPLPNQRLAWPRAAVAPAAPAAAQPDAAGVPCALWSAATERETRSPRLLQGGLPCPRAAAGDTRTHSPRPGLTGGALQHGGSGGAGDFAAGAGMACPGGPAGTLGAGGGWLSGPALALFFRGPSLGAGGVCQARRPGTARPQRRCVACLVCSAAPHAQGRDLGDRGRAGTARRLGLARPATSFSLPPLGSRATPLLQQHTHRLSSLLLQTRREGRLWPVTPRAPPWMPVQPPAPPRRGRSR